MSIGNIGSLDILNIGGSSQRLQQLQQGLAPKRREDAPVPDILPDAFIAQNEELREYLAERDAGYKAKNGDTPQNAVAVAMPVIPGLGVPFIKADQQRIIDGITEKYAGKKDFSGMMDELFAAEVHPWQLAANAQFFINPGNGRVTDAWNSGIQVRALDVYA